MTNDYSGMVLLGKAVVRVFTICVHLFVYMCCQNHPIYNDIMGLYQHFSTDREALTVPVLR